MRRQRKERINMEKSYKFSYPNSKFKSQNSKISGTSKPRTDLKERIHKHVLNTMKFIDLLPRNISCEIIGKQLLRSVTSIGANVSEAHASSSRKDFINFMTYSLKSANESLFWLKLMQDSGKGDQSSLRPIISEGEEIGKILGASVVTLKKSENAV